jgi:hypothetical protein
MCDVSRLSASIMEIVLVFALTIWGMMKAFAIVKTRVGRYIYERHKDHFGDRLGGPDSALG